MLKLFFVVESWRDKKINIKPHLLSDIIRRNGYRGHLRFVSGDENTGISRFINMNVFNFSLLSLSIVQINSIKDNLSENIHLLFKNSSFKSVIILVHKESNNFFL